MKYSLPYKLPTIVRAKRGWFVVYHYEIPGRASQFKRFEVKDGVNYVKDLEQKEKEIQRLRKDIEYSLKNGFNPFLADSKVFSDIVEAKSKIALQEEEKQVDGWLLTDMLEKFIIYCQYQDTQQFQGLSSPKAKRYKMAHLFNRREINECAHYQQIVQIQRQFCYLSVTKTMNEGETEFLVLVSFNTPQQAIEYYRERWQTETLFRAVKSCGFNIEHTNVTALKRLQKLIMLTVYV